MIFFNLNRFLTAPSDEDQQDVVATLRIREETISQRDRELAEREERIRREEARLRQWAADVADAASNLKGLFAKCDRFGFHQGAASIEEKAGIAIEALRPGRAAPEIVEKPKTKMRAHLPVPPQADEDDPDSNVAFFHQDPEVGLCIRLPGINDEPLPAFLSLESVLHADMKQLSLLDEESAGIMDLLAQVA